MSWQFDSPPPPPLQPPPLEPPPLQLPAPAGADADAVVPLNLEPLFQGVAHATSTPAARPTHKRSRSSACSNQ